MQGHIASVPVGAVPAADLLLKAYNNWQGDYQCKSSSFAEIGCDRIPAKWGAVDCMYTVTRRRVSLENC